MVAFVSLKREAIQYAVRDMYTAVARMPGRVFHFPTGAAACRLLGYPQEQIEALPATAVESFAGVGYPFAAHMIRAGDHVLDIGSGSGTDALICAKLVGNEGRVYGLDMTAEMCNKLRSNVAATGITNLEILDGEAEAIPLPDASVDVVTTNGVLNLVPDKARAFAEIFRVLKPGGRLQISDIALARGVSERFRQDPQLWAECVVGAVEEERYLEMLRLAGLESVERIGHLDYFAYSSNEKTREVARLFNAHSITIRARKPVAATAPTISTRRAALNLLAQVASIVTAVMAWFACAGLPALLAAMGAIGAGSLATHGYMFPSYVAFLGACVWLLWRSGRLRREYRPFWLALTGAVFATASTWLAIVGIAPILGWWSYLGVACIVVASIWGFVLARRPGNCVEEMIIDAKLREQRGTPARRLVTAALTCLLIAATFYGLHTSVEIFTLR